jgi:hypothetical protein
MSEEVEQKWKIVGIHPADAFFGEKDWKMYGFHRNVIKIENQMTSYLESSFIFARIYFEPGNDGYGNPLPEELNDFLFAGVLLEEI